MQGIDILSSLASSAGLVALAGVLIAAAFILIPPLRAWFTARSADEQSALTAWLILILAALALLGSCANVFTVVPCTSAGFLEYVGNVVFAAVLGVAANRGVFTLARVWRSSGSRAESKDLAPAPSGRAKLLDD